MRAVLYKKLRSYKTLDAFSSEIKLSSLNSFGNIRIYYFFFFNASKSLKIAIAPETLMSHYNL